MMKTSSLALMLLFSAALAGCLVIDPQPTGGGGGGDDMTMSGAGSGDMSHSASGGDMAQSQSGSTDMAMSSADLAGSGNLLALCQPCTQNGDCASGLCAAYMMGAVKKCSHSCAAATAATDCPGINACNGMNVCKCQ
jgi:hypothetical protein